MAYKTKKIHWFYNGKKHTGTAEWVKSVDTEWISIANSRGHIFDNVELEDLDEGITMQDVWDMIPDDISGFELR